jgi:hypothetical protein
MNQHALTIADIFCIYVLIIKQNISYVNLGSYNSQFWRIKRLAVSFRVGSLETFDFQQTEEEMVF